MECIFKSFLSYQLIPNKYIKWIENQFSFIRHETKNEKEYNRQIERCKWKIHFRGFKKDKWKITKAAFIKNIYCFFFIRVRPGIFSIQVFKWSSSSWKGCKFRISSKLNHYFFAFDLFVPYDSLVLSTTDPKISRKGLERSTSTNEIYKYSFEYHKFHYINTFVTISFEVFLRIIILLSKISQCIIIYYS